MKKLLLLPLGAAFGLLSLGVLPGCGSRNTTASATPEAASPAAQAHALEDSLLAHHELAMQQTERLFALKAQLTAAKVPASAPIQAKMQTADRAMMTWMHQYQAPDSAAPAAQRLAYLQDQQKQLTAIEQQLRTTLDSAQATLGRATAPKAAAPAPTAAQPK
ncbi:hypothetical protein GCM10023172_13840 [Hymenobacter ginsengisoli]|uniref:Viral A-type inclusion protein n=1 Tax=Hymenobacter ginsengisoli TaxID=1051626 RepID=A0ABP8Q6A1_9BACT|nr:MULTISPECIES: hypothetical protein [unclassified Hymenobacter]MBO2033625.1 hypothetical protein [Hymenobacter sp. BT559]